MHRTSDELYSKCAPVPRDLLRSLHKKERVQAFVSELLSFQQKIALGVNLTTGEHRERIHTLFRKHIANEQTLIPTLREVLEVYERGLRQLDMVLAESLGIKPETLNYPKFTLSQQPTWQRTYDNAVDSAVQAAQADLARYAATWVGADVISDGIRDASSSLGLWGFEEGSWGDAIAKFALDVTVDAALDAATDQSDAIVVTMQAQLAQTEKAILDGPGGFLATLRSITDSHKEFQKRLVFPVQQARK
jgi:hypothetical protein